MDDLSDLMQTICHFIYNFYYSSATINSADLS